jgi:nitronate monooxygenase
MPKIETALTRSLGIAHPILLAPMGSAAGGKLAAAVTNAGGLGLIGSGYADAATVSRELLAAGNARVGVGFITWALDARPEALRGALDAKPAAVMLSFGDPEPYVTQIRDAGAKTICQVQTLGEAEQAVRLGVDVIIAQGRDAGGHSGTTRHDGLRASRGRHRRLDPRSRRWWHRRWPRPGGGVEPGRLGRVDGHPLHGDP